MKFNVNKAPDGWRWNLIASNGRVICSGEAYNKPQKVVRVLERYIVRDDPDLAVALERALKKAGLDETGAQLKDSP